MSQSKVRAVCNEIRSYLIAHADAAYARKYARYFVEGYDAYGLDRKDPAWEQRRVEWGERLRAISASAFLEAGDLLVRTGKYEEAFCAIRFARDRADADSREVFARLGAWFDGGIINWAQCDVLSGDVLVRYLGNGTVGLDALGPWVASPHKYQRRAVPVTLIGILDQQQSYAPLLDLITPLMDDREKVVQQGAGWFLREAWKRQPAVVEAFLKQHKDHCARLIVQYATEKMSKERKEKFRRSK